jgi:choline-glycine betaine transporter
MFWGVATGASASILLLAGGLEALQQASIIAAAPFMLVMIGLCVGLYKALDTDPLVQRAPVTEAGGHPGPRGQRRGPGRHSRADAGLT